MEQPSEAAQTEGTEGTGEVAQKVQRWTEVTPSQFTHEAEGLNIIRALLPDQPSFRAWSNFEFRDGHGKWHEVDLLVIGRRRIHLVELKYYRGTLRGNDRTWRRSGHHAEDSPLLLARRKAQRLASRLQDELLYWAQENNHRLPDVRNVIPYVQESVFLHHPDFRCELPPRSRLDLFGLDGRTDHTGLDGISGRLLEAATPNQAIGPNQSDIVAELLVKMGIMPRRQREAGSWVIDEDSIGEGDGWQDWPAFHRVVTTDRARIRFLVSPPGATSTEQARVKQVAEHEYRIMSRLPNELLLRPKDLVQNDLGVGLVYPFDERFQRLDLYLADHAGQLATEDHISLLEQAAEAVSYAHRNRIVHRGLTPHAVLVRTRDDGSLRVMVGDWQSAGTVGGTPMTSVPGSGVTPLASSGQSPDHHSSERPVASPHPVPPDVDRQIAEVFQAPEGVWSRKADRVKLDVFALGALAYYVLSGQMPAADRTTLRERLNRDGGLDLAVDLPQVTPELRKLVLDATRPAVTERLADVRAFINQLEEAAASLEEPTEDAVDPLDAPPGSVIDGRFRVVRKLGTGSTAVGLLVNDLTIGETGPDTVRVLKVALNEAAAARLVSEATVLAGLRHPRLVRLVEGPVTVGGRQALVLESSGDQTLGEALRGRERLSLDLLDRWGTDLLEALVALDRAGVDHRDIKPANLGVREGRGDRVKHLVLFDFSLSTAGATAVTAGTPPYLDPFLDSPLRGRYDSAAERYSAAVVLFEMATGSSPRFGDGLSDPASVKDEAAVEAAMFDQAVADQMTGFFTKALARDARKRHDTAGEMLAAWQAAFQPVPTVPDNADALAAKAVPSTPLSQSGLSARALSAVEPLAVATVADLVAVDSVRLHRLSGVADVTRREVTSRARQWRDKFGAAISGRATAHGTADGSDESLPDPVAAADLLLTHAGGPRATANRALVRRILGLDEGCDAFANQGELAQASGVTRGRIPQQLGKIQSEWGASVDCVRVLDTIAEVAWESLTGSAGVATVEELAQSVLAVMPPAADGTGKPSVDRLAAGLLRLALDRNRDRIRAKDDTREFVPRRRDGRIALLATSQLLLDPAEALGRAADGLIAQGEAAGEPVIPGARAAERLRSVWDQATAGLEPAPAAPDTGRLLRLAAALARHAALAGSRDLYTRDMTPAVALAIALSGVGSQPVSVREVHARVRAKFPALPPLPDRPRLDQLISNAGLGLIYDEDQRAYRSPTRASDTLGLTSRPPTQHAPLNTSLVADGPSGHRLAESAATRSFLSLGVDARWLDKSLAALADRFGTEVVNVTQVLIDAMKELAAQFGLDWDFVQEADAAAAGTRDAEGLSVLVQRSLPAVTDAINAAAAAHPAGTRPVLLTEVSPLARYGHLNVLSEWSDLATRRPQAIWVLVPQLAGSHGAIIDRKPIPLAAPAQYLRLDPDWISDNSRVPVSEGER
jgi:serine/threonine protein kinase